ncbi:MAG: YtxH domain-containing protein [Polyangia bacterium]
MRLQSIKNMSKENVLGMVGLKTRNPLRAWLAGSGLVGIGLAVGATVALLLTPKSGPEIRDSMLDGWHSLRKRAARAGVELTH